jgi:hypothetical protein
MKSPTERKADRIKFQTSVDVNSLTGKEYPYNQESTINYKQVNKTKTIEDKKDDEGLTENENKITIFDILDIDN